MQKKIVFIGGGGGVSSIAPGLRDDFDVTAIISTFDDGGSTGRLKQAFDTPAVGDLRKAFAALSTNKYAHLLNHRFEKGDIEGHTVGNLLITAAMEEEKDSSTAIKKLHELFEIKGKVLGVSYAYSELHAELMDRTMVHGEHNIDEPRKGKEHIRVNRAWLDPEVQPAAGVLEAIAEAEVIIMGPGDIYTSIAPCLMVEGVAKAVVESAAKKVYFCNTHTAAGQTNGFAASDHVRAIEYYFEKPGVFETIILPIPSYPKEADDQHAERGEKPVKQDIENLEAAGYAVIKADLFKAELAEHSKADRLKRAKVAYDPLKVKALVDKL